MVVPADTIIATETKHVSDCVYTSSGHGNKDLWIMCGISEDYKSGRSSLLPCLTLTAVCMRLKRVKREPS